MTRTTAPTNPKAPVLRGFHELQVLFSPDARWEKHVSRLKGAVVFGREGAAPDLVFEDDKMSRRHGRFDFDESGRVRVADLGSRNGTHRNGAPVLEGGATLDDGDVVRAGDTIFLVRKVTAEAPPFLGGSARILGASRAIRDVLRRIALAAKGRLPALVVGETGTGKELVAREIHELSESRGSLIAVNGSAVPRDLFESAFFGHKKGSFSGALDDQEGYFQAADGGTLFLDEVGEIPLVAQAKLLRAIETMEVTAVGSTKPRRVGVRIVAATNRDLHAEVAGGGFRADLLARLEGVTIRLPPLRARREDIVPLFVHYLGEHRREVTLTADFVEPLVIHPWPGNVRAVVHAAGRFALEVSADELLTAEHATRVLPDVRGADVATSASAEAAASAPHPSDRSTAPPKDEILRAFEEAGGKVSDVAARFNTNRQQIYRWVSYWGLDASALRRMGRAKDE